MPTLSKPRTRRQPPLASSSPAPSPSAQDTYSVLDQVEMHQGVLRAAQLAKILGTTRKTIYAMMSDGRIPTIQDGLESKRVDPKSYAYVLRKKNPMMREAARRAS